MVFVKCIFGLPLFILLVQNGKGLIVQINNGRLRGQVNKTVGLNLTYIAYKGIPYAEPPTGSLRFEPPVPKRNWKNVLDAKKDGNICVQGFNPVLGSEDCLFINVYVPKMSQSNNQLLPTMVFIYGGGFTMGSSTYNVYGPDYLLEKNVVVVTFNYRLDIFGFLSTGDLVAPGNNGLKDQVLALKWVRDNIKSFGGDPNRVTIFGESAGAASVSYHMQSPQSQGLFHAAIMESGVSMSPWALSRRVPEVVKQIGKDLALNTSNSRELVNELKRVDYKLLQSKSFLAQIFQYLKQDPRYGLIFGPVIEPEHDNAFFTKKSHQLLVEGKFSKVPCIVGFNSLEGAVDFGVLQPIFKLYMLQYDLDYTRLLQPDLNINEDKKNTAASTIKKHYFGNNLIALSEPQFLKFLSDDMFVRSSREYVRQVSKHVAVYFYRFSHEGALGGRQNRTQPGVAHAEELGYIWRSSFTPSRRDIVTRNRMTSMWTNFAKTGNPTPEKFEVIWEKSDENFTYLDIGYDLNLKQFPEKLSMKLWDYIYQTYGNPPYDTY